MQIKSFEDAHSVLSQYVPPAKKFREAYTLDNMRNLMHALGNPQNTYKVIHVAGTSGKTSTAYFAAALIKETGKKVGLTVSPHMASINERVQINLAPLEEEKFCQELTTFLEIINKLTIKPTFFELLVAFAFWEFARAGVDYAVVEVGLGGLLDGTNVIDDPEKVCVITDIGFDHTDILGNTIEEIAEQKAGIIQPGNHAFVHSQAEAVLQQIKDRVEEQNATLHVVNQMPPTQLPASMPLFQQRNWLLAHAVYLFVVERDGLSQIDSSALTRTMSFTVPGRLEVFTIGNKTIILDGAHNQQKMESLVESLQKLYPDQPIAVLLAIITSKRSKVQAVLNELQKITRHIVITDFVTEQDLRKVALPPQKIIDNFRDEIDVEFEACPGPEEAFEKILQSPEKIILVTGSLYLLNMLRPIVLNKDT